MLSALMSAAGAAAAPAFHPVAAAPAGLDLSVVLLVLAGFVALYLLLNNKQQANHVVPAPAAAAPSGEVRALQDTVRMLVEAQQRAQMHPSQSWADRSSSRPGQQQQPQQLRQASASSVSYGNDSDLSLPLSPTFGNANGVPVELLNDLRVMSESVKNLERKNRELTRQLTLTEVSNVVDLEKKYKLPIPVVDSSSGATTIQQVNLSASEIETIRAIFNMFDTEQKGEISTRELQALHKQLGEPLTDDEANAAVSELDQDGSGTVSFNKFLIWWYHQHSQGGKKGSAYTQRFKLMHAKLTTREFNVDKVITQDSGEVYTLEYRLNFYYKNNNQSLKQISPWHDIPLNRLGSGEQGQLFNFVCEIPKWTRAKFECATGELFNPIKQDTQHGKLRYYKHGDMMFNYGFFPQTWEDPDVTPNDTGCPGDNDPIDCVEIGATQLRVGAIAAVKVLGLLGLIDDGETDWKVIAISISDPMAHVLNDVDDVEQHLPGAIKAIREYFRDYKSFSGKINTYALRAQAMPRQYALKVIEETHHHWRSLHLVKKRDVIGESVTQLGTRAPGAPAAVPSAELPQHAQALLAAASSASPRIVASQNPSTPVLSNPLPAAVPQLGQSPTQRSLNGGARPVIPSTGMDGPVDKLLASSGK